MWRIPPLPGAQPWGVRMTSEGCDPKGSQIGSQIQEAFEDPTKIRREVIERQDLQLSWS